MSYTSVSHALWDSNDTMKFSCFHCFRGLSHSSLLGKYSVHSVMNSHFCRDKRKLTWLNVSWDGGSWWGSRSAIRSPFFRAAVLQISGTAFHSDVCSTFAPSNNNGAAFLLPSTCCLVYKTIQVTSAETPDSQTHTQILSITLPLFYPSLLRSSKFSLIPLVIAYISALTSNVHLTLLSFGRLWVPASNTFLLHLVTEPLRIKVFRTLDGKLLRPSTEYNSPTSAGVPTVPLPFNAIARNNLSSRLHNNCDIKDSILLSALQTRKWLSLVVKFFQHIQSLRYQLIHPTSHITNSKECTQT